MQTAAIILTRCNRLDQVLLTRNIKCKLTKENHQSCIYISQLCPKYIYIIPEVAFKYNHKDRGRSMRKPVCHYKS